MSRTEQALQELATAIAKYAVHLKSHTAAIQGLSEASHELKQSAAEQNRVLAYLVESITQIPPRTEPVTGSEEKQTSPPGKDTHTPGHYHSQQQPARPLTLAEKQRKLLEKRAGKKGGFKPSSEDATERSPEQTRYKRQPRPPL
jgi:hypothetical protein